MLKAKKLFLSIMVVSIFVIGIFSLTSCNKGDDSGTIIDKENLQNKRIILVDDIYTTGNTVNECCRILQKAQPKSISVIVIAKD